MAGISNITGTPNEVVPVEEIADELARIVRNAFIEAENYRRFSGVEERLLRALRMRRYQYDPEDVALLGGIDIYIGLGAMKSRAASSWINDILLNSLDKPWTIKSDTIPDLPEWLKEQVVDALEMELQQMGVPANIRARAKQLKDAAYTYAVKKATDAASGMENKIADQMVKGDWRLVFAQFIDDLTTFPLAIIRGPIIQKKKVLDWTGNTVLEEDEVIYTDRRISPFDFYPAMNSTTTQDGTFLIERFQAQPELLHKCLNLEGFNEDAIREILNEYGNHGFSELLRPDYQRRFLEDKYQSNYDLGTIDTLIYNGRIVGSSLIDNGVMVPDPQEYYEVEVWTVNNRTIKAILNPYPLQIRPVFATSFVKVPGSLWGEGLLDILRDMQRVVNSCARSIVRNMSFSSGPFGEVEVSRLQEGEIPQELTPYKLFHVDPDLSGGNKPAFTFHNIDSVAPQLMQIFDRFGKLADDLSGVPAYVLGNPAVAGAGRTMGGLAMLMANAAKGIKNVILNVDRDVIEPRITLQYNMNMKFDTDFDIKGDAQIIARGATGLLQRELSQARMVELLQTYLPYVQAGLIPQLGAQIMIRESMKNTGLPIDEILPNPNPNSALATQLTRIGATPADVQGLQTGQSNPPQPLGARSVSPAFPQQSPGFPFSKAALMPSEPPPGAPINLPTGA
ncbi:MAG: hypothetical protein ACREQ5_04275 [Candidatus Dormibacteria bacterium]